MTPLDRFIASAVVFATGLGLGASLVPAARVVPHYVEPATLSPTAFQQPSDPLWLSAGRDKMRHRAARLSARVDHWERPILSLVGAPTQDRVTVARLAIQDGSGAWWVTVAALCPNHNATTFWLLDHGDTWWPVTGPPDSGVDGAVPLGLGNDSLHTSPIPYLVEFRIAGEPLVADFYGMTMLANVVYLMEIHS